MWDACEHLCDPGCPCFCPGLLPGQKPSPDHCARSISSRSVMHLPPLASAARRRSGTKVGNTAYYQNHQSHAVVNTGPMQCGSFRIRYVSHIEHSRLTSAASPQRVRPPNSELTMHASRFNAAWQQFIREMWHMSAQPSGQPGFLAVHAPYHSGWSRMQPLIFVAGPFSSAERQAGKSAASPCSAPTSFSQGTRPTNTVPAFQQGHHGPNGCCSAAAAAAAALTTLNNPHPLWHRFAAGTARSQPCSVSYKRRSSSM